MVIQYGMHNAFTAYPLKGWQGLFGWLIHPFSQCQNKKVGEKSDVTLLDIQVALDKGVWRVSHGFAWYSATIGKILQYYINRHDTTHFRLGYDRHFGQKQDIEKFKNLINIIDTISSIDLYEAYVETPDGLDFLRKRLPGEDSGNPLNSFERYWSMAWAKSQVKKHWYLFPVLLPIPRLWTWVYKKKWLREFERARCDIFITDFV